MKLLVLVALVVAGLVGVCTSIPAPIVPKDNSHYVEGESRYIWMSGGDGEPRLVDLQEPVQEELLRSRNGANNQYWLYTRWNPNNPQLITHNNANSIWASNYVASRPLIVLVHGWTHSINSPLNPLLRHAFLDVMDCNLLVLDWGHMASANYITAVAGVPGIGQFLGNFLAWLINTAGGNWNNVHLVGHSLGAHVIGNAGRTIGNLPSRLTGLDPAGPLWLGNGNALRASDGQYVEGIHTDGGLQGIMTAVGNTDFYPNGGRNPQPSCSTSSCSHGIVVDFFEASIRFNHLVGRLCTNVAQAESNGCTGNALNMGNSILNKRGNGIYGLRTGSVWPF